MGLCSPHRPFQPLPPWPLRAHLTPRYRPSPGLQPQSAAGIPSRCLAWRSAPSPILCPLPRPLAPQACEALTTYWRPPGLELWRCSPQGTALPRAYGARAAKETRPCHSLLSGSSSSSPPHSKLDMDSHPPSAKASASLLPRQRPDRSMSERSDCCGFELQSLGGGLLCSNS